MTAPGAKQAGQGFGRPLDLQEITGEQQVFIDQAYLQVP
jgi:hypothetical protein